MKNRIISAIIALLFIAIMGITLHGHPYYKDIKIISTDNISLIPTPRPIPTNTTMLSPSITITSSIHTSTPTVKQIKQPTPVPKISENSQISDYALTKESDHFILHYNSKDEACIEDMILLLEDELIRVCSDLDYEYRNKVTVQIYRTREELLEDNHIYGYIAGMVTGEDSLILVSPLSEECNYEEQLLVAVHEFIHLVVNHVNWSVPAWLNEGIAYYECGQWEYIKEGFTDKVSNNQIPTFQELGNDYNDFFSIDGAHAFAFTLVEYMVDTYGYAKLNELVRSPSSFDDIFLLSKDEFWENWVTFLKTNYTSNN